MADFCVSDLFRKYCSTDAPGWLSGDHPSVAEGVVRRKVCFPGAVRGCCGYSSNISVRNCGSFFVYKLQPPPHCYLRYCGNGLPLARGKYKIFVSIISCLFTHVGVKTIRQSSFIDLVRNPRVNLVPRAFSLPSHFLRGKAQGMRLSWSNYFSRQNKTNSERPSNLKC